MKTYEVIEDEFGQTIKATEGGKTLWIPTDPNNSDYAEYLRFTAWVDEGNDPDEFWTQSDH
jgi:hypothetical protein